MGVMERERRRSGDIGGNQKWKGLRRGSR